MRAARDDAAGVEDDDAVDVRNSGQAVRDDDRGGAVVDGAERFLHDRFEPRVECARGFVQDENRRTPQQRARDRQPLTLAARELHAAIADRRIVPAGQTMDELIGARQRGGGFDRARIGPRHAVADVLCDRPREQRRVLLDSREVTAEPDRVEAADVMAADDDVPVARIVEAQHQVQDRGLAGSRFADQRDDLAGCDPQVDTRERFHIRPRGIGKVDVVEHERAVEIFRRLAAGDRDERNAAEQLEDPLRGAHGAQRFGGEPRRVAEPAGHEQRVQHERKQRARRELAGDDHVAADPDCEQRRALARDERDGAERRRRDDLAPRELHRARALAVVPRGLGGLLGERTDGANPADHLRCRRAGVRVRLLHVGGAAAHAPAEHRRRDHDWRHGQKREQRQPRRGVEQQARAEQREHREAQRVGEILSQHGLQRGDVGPEPGRDLAGVAAVEELDVLAEQRLKDQAAQTRRYALGPEVEAIIARPRGDRFDEQDTHHDQRELVQAMNPAAPDAIVDDEADHRGIREPGADAEDDERRAREVEAALGPHHTGDAPQLGVGGTHRSHNPLSTSIRSTCASSNWNLLPSSIGASHWLCQCQAKAPA